MNGLAFFKMNKCWLLANDNNCPICEQELSLPYRQFHVDSESNRYKQCPNGCFAVRYRKGNYLFHIFNKDYLVTEYHDELSILKMINSLFKQIEFYKTNERYIAEILEGTVNRKLQYG